MASTSSASGSKVITAYLKKIIGSPVGEFYNLFHSDVTIGRSTKSHIFIPDPNISRSHCTLKYKKDTWYITDLGGVNGTYLDGKKLQSEKPEILREGTAIYIGPPAEAPVAFMFLKNKNGEQVNKTERNNSQQLSSDIGVPSTSSGIRNGNHLALKRKIDSIPEYTTSISLLIKRMATPSSDSEMLPVPQTMTDQNSDEGNISDCSISSLDSLRTRIRKKNSSLKKSSQKPSAKNTDIISNSASPKLRTVNYNQLAPSTSTRNLPYSMPDVNEKLTIIKAGKSDLLLDEILNENSHPSQETNAADENSESLLNDSKILLDYEMHLSSQHEADEPHTGKPKNKFHTENLQSDEEHPASNKEMNLYTTLEKRLIAQLMNTKSYLQKTLEDKKNLICLVEAQRSRQKVKENEKISKDEFMKLLEEDLFCNICTEIFIKATTLGCSHTFCEHCINQWKTKRKSCPICREKIVTETRILVMDSFIDKIVELLGEDYKSKRQEVIESRIREKASAKKSKRKKGRAQRRRQHPNASAANNMSVGAPLHDAFSFSLSPSDTHLPFHSVIQLYSDPEESPSIDIVSQNYMDYCYNCGRRDHWAIDCPFN